MILKGLELIANSGIMYLKKTPKNKNQKTLDYTLPASYYRSRLLHILDSTGTVCFFELGDSHTQITEGHKNTLFF